MWAPETATSSSFPFLCLWDFFICMHWCAFYWILKGDLFQISEIHLFIPYLQFSLLSYSILWTWATLISLCFQLPLLNSRIPWAPPGFPCVAAWKLSQDTELGQHCFVSHFSRSSVLHCLMSSVLKTIASYILFIFYYFKQEGKFHLLLHFGQK